MPQDLKETGQAKSWDITERQFGALTNVPIFTVFKSRAECSESWVHRPRFAGIDGNGTDGTYSIVLSEKYADDEDWGELIIYTGAGGKLEWTDTDQAMDQSWGVHPNTALRTSHIIGNSIRVIRSSQSTSAYAPYTGYRYDGLYRITARRRVKGRNGFMVCRCVMERLPDQPPIPIYPHRFPPVGRPNLDWVDNNAIGDGDGTGEEGKEH